MPSLQHYQALFQKRASEELKPLQNTVDNQEVANKEHDKNLTGSRETLMELFTHAPMSSKEQTKTVKKLFDMKGDVDTGNPLLKIAQMVLGRPPENLEFLKSASAAYRQVAGASFLDEVEKIANIANLGDFAHAAKAKAPKKLLKVEKIAASAGGVADFMDSARKAAKFVEPHARELGKKVKETVEKHPFISTGTGFVTGAAYGHSRGRKEEREAHQAYSGDHEYR